MIATVSAQPSPHIRTDGTFPVIWDNPADAEQTWVWSREHMPLPLSPLSIDHLRATKQVTDSELGRRAHERTVAVFPNGYRYTLQPPAPDPGAPPDPVAEERRRRWQALAARLLDAWQRQFEPEIRRLCWATRDRDYEAMSAAEIAGLLETCFADCARAHALTEVMGEAMLEALGPFQAFCNDVFGTDAAASKVGVMLGGYANHTAASEVAAWRLARLVDTLPTVRQVVLSCRPEALWAALCGVSGADTFVGATRRYLNEYGWRSPMWFELTHPTWVDDATPLFGLIQRYLADPTVDPRLAIARAAARRRRLVRSTRLQLACDPQRLARFEALYAAPRHYILVSEHRAHWQLTAIGVLRRPCLALGRKLRALGELDGSDDVFYLGMDELHRLATTKRADPVAGPDWRALIAQRRADRAHWLQVVPPPVIGKPSPPAQAQTAQGPSLSDGPSSKAVESRVLTGGAASWGVAQGRARVVHTMADSDSFAPGEVLVCRTTSPAWTPLIARAAAVVTDSGGILAHCAIITRELAIPCVVGTGVATERIVDGMIVTVNGTQGLVRLGPLLADGVNWRPE
jgi:rifampicin phosphotransferase